MQLGCTEITVSLIEAVLRQHPTAADQLLVKLYEFFTHRPLPVYKNTFNKECQRVGINVNGERAMTCIVKDHKNDVIDKNNDNLNSDNFTGNEEKQHERTTNKEVEEIIIISPVAASAEETEETQENEFRFVKGHEKNYEKEYKYVKQLTKALPQYACPTAATLTHRATHPTRSISLHTDKFEMDVHKEQNRNKQLIAEHDKAQRLLRSHVLVYVNHSAVSCNDKNSHGAAIGTDAADKCVNTSTGHAKANTLPAITTEMNNKKNNNKTNVESLIEHFRNKFATQVEKKSKTNRKANGKKKQKKSCTEHIKKMEEFEQQELISEKEKSYQNDDNSYLDEEERLENIVREILMSDDDDDCSVVAVNDNKENNIDDNNNNKKNE